MQVWPSELQQLLNESGFGINFGETVLRSDVEVGPAKTRRRFTRGVDEFSTSINLTIAQYNLFYTFYSTTLAGGSLPFTFNHPVTGIPETFRFKGPPSISSLGGGHFIASMNWEKMP